jgi:hypothetical protein
MQANFVIWVEGPSDCIYICHWQSLMAPEVSEGIDYSVMFYGGRLLSHLSMERNDDAELSTDEFVKLLRINQHSDIVIDSDKDSKRSEINATKRRSAEEYQRQGVLCLVTKGREIENYLAPEAIEQVNESLTKLVEAIRAAK